MCEVTKQNFEEKFPLIKKSVENARFISIDLEFSALQPVEELRLFDTNKERYTKLCTNLLNVIPLQIGLTAFQFNNECDDYFGEVFTFYIAPTVFGDINKSYFFQASTTNFLCLHQFDFNKFAYSGIPYLNNEEELTLRKRLKNKEFLDENCHLSHEFSIAVKTCFPTILKWHNTSKVGDFLEIPDLKKYQYVYELIYSVHKQIRSRFENVWTSEENGNFYVKKVSNEELEKLQKQCSLEETIINKVLGFKRVFNLLKQVRKPIVGHNVAQDLMIMVHNFETSLPSSYSQFKALTHSLFPTIFDTKSIFYHLRSTIPKDKLPEDVSLEALFTYFKDGLGRHLVTDTTAIESNIDKNKIGRYHDAGWDSFCTGYIFLRMGYFNIAKLYPKNKKFVSTEIISGLSQFKNCINVIRGATSYIKLDGEDPISKRPPWLIVESVQNEPVDLSDLVTTLSDFGYVDVKKLSKKRVLIAIDNHRTARYISNSFKMSNKFRVKEYNFFRHSPIAQAVFLSAVTISGTLLLWLTHSMSKR